MNDAPKHLNITGRYKFMPRGRYTWTLMLLLVTCAQAQVAEKPKTYSRTCVTAECHNTYKNRKNTHVPVAHDVCKFCHKPDDRTQHTFRLLREGGGLCVKCHREMPVDKNGHKPLEGQECVGCHDPHGSDYPFMVYTAKVSDMCNDCHEELIKDKSFLHDPLKTGECTVCHNPHHSDYPKLLINEPNELCFSCHEIIRNQMQNVEFVHQAVTDDGCLGCHDAHASGHAMILHEGVPELCFSCHEEVKQVVLNSACKHTAASDPNGCNSCHNPHASKVPFGLRADPKALCLSCHDRQIITNDLEVLPDFKQLLEKKKYLHGAVDDYSCNACHVSHGSNNHRLLTMEYTSSFYTSYDANSYELCFSCHLETMVQEDDAENLTDFRNGDLNLHYLHVKKPEKGRTCRACHATHASNIPKLISESVVFGSWEYHIEFEMTDTGGSCVSGCHIPRQYDRLTPVP